MIEINTLIGQRITLDDQGKVTIEEAFGAKKKKKKKGYWHEEQEGETLDAPVE